jgi:Uma2 family endonuclease
MTTAPKLLSYNDWLELPVNDSLREECVNGVIEVMPPAKWQHTVVVERLTRQLWKKLDENTTMVVSSNFGLVIRQNPLTQRTPDIAVFSLAKLVERDGYIHSAPELAVEVLSPSNTPARVRNTLSDYASIGVPEAWVVNLNEQSIAVHRLGQAVYERAVVPYNGSATLLAFPAVTIEFSTIW